MPSSLWAMTPRIRVPASGVTPTVPGGPETASTVIGGVVPYAGPEKSSDRIGAPKKAEQIGVADASMTVPAGTVA